MSRGIHQAARRLASEGRGRDRACPEKLGGRHRPVSKVHALATPLILL